MSKSSSTTWPHPSTAIPLMHQGTGVRSVMAHDHIGNALPVPAERTIEAVYPCMPHRQAAVVRGPLKRQYEEMSAFEYHHDGTYSVPVPWHCDQVSHGASPRR